MSRFDHVSHTFYDANGNPFAAQHATVNAENFDPFFHIPTNFQPTPFDTVLDRMRATQQAKDADYSGSVPYGNLRACEAFGVDAVMGVLVRMSDKWQRIQTLVGHLGDMRVANETLDDTLLDLACYAVIALVLREQAREDAAIEREGEE